MGDSRYKRVSRQRPCLICGKPDWCSRTADDSISFCARVTAGADRLSRKERWGVFYHDRELLNRPFWEFNDGCERKKRPHVGRTLDGESALRVRAGLVSNQIPDGLNRRRTNRNQRGTFGGITRFRRRKINELKIYEIHEKPKIYSSIRHRGHLVFVFDVSGSAARASAVCHVRCDELRASSR